MFAVVVLHTASPLLFAYKTTTVGNWMASDVYNAVTRFAVPVFVMITGALSLGREYELSSFLKKRIGRLILPFLFWSLVYVFYQWYEEIIYFKGTVWENICLVLHQLKTGTSYHLWYVYLLIGLYLIIPIIGRFARQATEKELRYFLALWFITILISGPYLSRYSTAIELRYFSGYIGYLVLGYYLANKQINFPGLALIATLLFVCFAIVIAIGTYYLEVKTHELSTFFYEPLGPFVVVLAASAFLIAKNTLITIGPRLTKVFDKASANTLGIYFVHALILNILEINDINYLIFSPWIGIPVVALICFLISWLVIWVMGKVPVLKHITG
ncbi:hypothetical protein BC343_05595 [Mucilaginibacter pedocola]|uniref:Acyltransferase 3 domain-containing protein n=2 Tax=Mucilaginibacter pedocola TaxID=1792845 RepID=A0A1S9PGF9_9SPHI|nr:hypothetical protein BC343_05595 [Mucilaginibacter pedocola]